MVTDEELITSYEARGYFHEGGGILCKNGSRVDAIGLREAVMVKKSKRPPLPPQPHWRDFPLLAAREGVLVHTTGGLRVRRYPLRLSMSPLEVECWLDSEPLSEPDPGDRWGYDPAHFEAILRWAQERASVVSAGPALPGNELQQNPAAECPPECLEDGMRKSLNAEQWDRVKAFMAKRTQGEFERDFKGRFAVVLGRVVNGGDPNVAARGRVNKRGIRIQAESTPRLSTELITEALKFCRK